MKQNGFQLNNCYFEENEEMTMSFLANLFMSKVEVKAKDEFNYFPRIYILIK